MELIQYDLSLGLAMSKSLEKNEQNASNKIDEKEEASKELQKFNKVSDLSMF